MSSTKVALALGWDCFINDDGPYWALPSGLRCANHPDYLNGQCVEHIAAWAHQRGYVITCQLLVDGVLAWLERDEEEVDNAVYADTIAEAVCYAFLDLHAVLNQNEKPYGE